VAPHQGQDYACLETSSATGPWQAWVKRELERWPQMTDQRDDAMPEQWWLVNGY
jgi:hypothetical protein